MDVRTLWKRHEDLLIPLLCIALLSGIAAAGFDYYYDLNDDVLIRDILSGVYTGVPEGRTAQMLWPLGAFLALLYHMLPGVPVFGGFLWLCQAGSIWCILRRSLRFARTGRGKLFLNLAETAAAGSLLFYHLVFVQYTVTGGLLMTAALFRFLTSEGAAGGVCRFLWKNMPSVLLALLSFMLRPEMMLLLLPLAALGGVWKWAEERPVFTKPNIACYVGLFALILMGMAAAWAADRAACGDEAWREFGALFDARTEIYDFKSAGLRSFEKNREFYEELGLSESQCRMLENYNYGVSDRIDAEILEKISEKGLETEGYFLHSLGEGLWLYRERLRNNQAIGMDEMPQLLFEAALLVLVLLAGLRRRKGEILWQLLLFAGVRSILWMYLILRERVPARISHPLYFAEIVVLLYLLLKMLWEERENGKTEKGHGHGGAGLLLSFPVRYPAAVLLLSCVLAGLPREICRTAEEYVRREQTNETDRRARDFYRAHPENLYLADVMSTVDFSQKLFAPEEGYGNYDLLGGWLCKSPLTEKKLRSFGYTSMEEAITEGENVYLAGKPETSWDWLTAFLAEQGIRAKIQSVDVIESSSGGWRIWKCVRADAQDDRAGR